MPLMDSYKFLHFFYDLSNLWHFIPLQCIFLFTSRGGLSQNVKRLWEGKDLHSFQLNLQKNPTVGSADTGRIKLPRVHFHQKVQRGRARQLLARAVPCCQSETEGPAQRFKAGGGQGPPDHASLARHEERAHSSGRKPTDPNGSG